MGTLSFPANFFICSSHAGWLVLYFPPITAGRFYHRPICLYQICSKSEKATWTALYQRTIPPFTKVLQREASPISQALKLDDPNLSQSSSKSSTSATPSSPAPSACSWSCCILSIAFCALNISNAISMFSRHFSGDSIFGTDNKYAYKSTAHEERWGRGVQKQPRQNHRIRQTQEGEVTAPCFIDVFRTDDTNIQCRCITLKNAVYIHSFFLSRFIFPFSRRWGLFSMHRLDINKIKHSSLLITPLTGGTTVIITQKRLIRLWNLRIDESRNYVISLTISLKPGSWVMACLRVGLSRMACRACSIFSGLPSTSSIISEFIISWKASVIERVIERGKINHLRGDTIVEPDRCEWKHILASKWLEKCIVLYQYQREHDLSVK